MAVAFLHPRVAQAAASLPATKAALAAQQHALAAERLAEERRAVAQSGDRCAFCGEAWQRWGPHAIVSAPCAARLSHKTTDKR